MTKKHSDATLAMISFVFMTAGYALLSVLARYLNNGFSISQQVYLRVLVALFLALLLFRARLRWRKIIHLPAREWGVIAFRGLAGYGIAVTLISKAATLTLISHVAFLAALPAAPLLGFLFLREKVTWQKVAFVLLSLVGVLLLAVRDFHELLVWNTGDVLAVIATVVFSISYIARKWHSKDVNNHEITTLTFVFGFLSVLIISLVAGEGAPPMVHSWQLWLAVLAGGVLNVTNMFLVNYGFEHLDAVRGGNLLNLECVWGLVFGLLIYHEWPTWRGLLGGAIIVASVIGMNMYTHREEVKFAGLQQETDT